MKVLCRSDELTKWALCFTIILLLLPPFSRLECIVPLNYCSMTHPFLTFHHLCFPHSTTLFQFERRKAFSRIPRPISPENPRKTGNSNVHSKLPKIKLESIFSFQGQNVVKKSLRVLVVDDSLMSRKMIMKLLNQCGHYSIGAEDGQACVDIISKMMRRNSDVSVEGESSGSEYQCDTNLSSNNIERDFNLDENHTYLYGNKRTGFDHSDDYNRDRDRDNGLNNGLRNGYDCGDHYVVSDDDNSDNYDDSYDGDENEIENDDGIENEREHENDKCLCLCGINVVLMDNHMPTMSGNQ